jgi:shikimate dehydrogenase
MPRLAVLGQPVSHSRSPAMHNAALAELELAPEWTYEAIEVAPDGFAALVESLPEQGFAGVNVTVPHKLAALDVATATSAAARAVGAANTLTFRDGEIEAANTDTEGILAALPNWPAGMRALVMGAGGSARAAIWALREAGAAVHVWNRTHEKAERLASAFDVAMLPGSATEAAATTPDFDLIVNATTVGLSRANAQAPAEGQPLGDSGFEDLKALPVSADALRAGQVVMDLVYGMKETQLTAAARAAGASAVDGLEVLVRQGAASLRLWTGAVPRLETMRAAARSR